jgi:hypothetical protein
MKRGTTNRNARGSAEARRARRQWLLDAFGDGVRAACSFGCGAVVTLETMSVDRYPIAGVNGGTYRRGNIRPACEPCNYTYGGAIRRAE